MGGEHKTWEHSALQPLDGEWLSAALVLSECGGRRAAPVIDCFMSHQVRIGAGGGGRGGWADLHLLFGPVVPARSFLLARGPHPRPKAAAGVYSCKAVGESKRESGRKKGKKVQDGRC